MNTIRNSLSYVFKNRLMGSCLLQTHSQQPSNHHYEWHNKEAKQGSITLIHPRLCIYRQKTKAKQQSSKNHKAKPPTSRESLEGKPQQHKKLRRKVQRPYPILRNSSFVYIGTSDQNEIIIYKRDLETGGENRIHMCVV